MKKILFVLPSLSVGGMEKMAVVLANKLTELGNSVTLMILENKTDLQDELSEGVRLIYKPNKQPFGKSVPYIRYKYYDDGMWETRVDPRQLYKYYIEEKGLTLRSPFSEGCP